jgi:hypothetical protein
VEDWKAPEAKKAEMWETPSYLRVERSATLDPAAKKAVEDHQIPDVEVAVIEPAGYSIAVPPPVSDNLEASFGVLSATSQVLRLSSYFEVYTTIVFKAAADVKLDEAFAPALVAMQKENTEGFLQALPTDRSRASITGLIQKGEYYTASLPFNDKPVFIVEHPISIHWQTPDRAPHAACVKVTSYSRFPVSLDDRFCYR